MSFVAILKTLKDKAEKEKTPAEKLLPPDYPLEVKEFQTLDEAKLAYPQAQIFTFENYVGYKTALCLVYDHVHGLIKKPWWKFWGK